MSSSSSSIFGYLSSSALSLTMAGNTGISPFLTLFLLALVEKIEPEWLNMGEVAENLLASWWALILLGILSAAEILGKCIPALDEIVDSIEVFVVPILSVLATLSTLGMLPAPSNGERLLLEESVAVDESDTNFGAAFLTATKVVLVIAGMVLSLLIHLLKMVIRIASLTCSAGCCQPCITTIEIAVVCVCVVLAILSPLFAMIACGLFFVGAWYVVTVKCCCKKDKDDDNDDEEKDVENPTPTAAEPAIAPQESGNEEERATPVEAKVY